MYCHFSPLSVVSVRPFRSILEGAKFGTRFYEISVLQIFWAGTNSDLRRPHLMSPNKERGILKLLFSKITIVYQYSYFVYIFYTIVPSEARRAGMPECMMADTRQQGSGAGMFHRQMLPAKALSWFDGIMFATAPRSSISHVPPWRVKAPVLRRGKGDILDLAPKHKGEYHAVSQGARICLLKTPTREEVCWGETSTDN